MTPYFNMSCTWVLVSAWYAYGRRRGYCQFGALLPVFMVCWITLVWPKPGFLKPFLADAPLASWQTPSAPYPINTSELFSWKNQHYTKNMHLKNNDIKAGLRRLLNIFDLQHHPLINACNYTNMKALFQIENNSIKQQNIFSKVITNNK